MARKSADEAAQDSAEATEATPKKHRGPHLRRGRKHIDEHESEASNDAASQSAEAPGSTGADSEPRGKAGVDDTAAQGGKAKRKHARKKEKAKAKGEAQGSGALSSAKHAAKGAGHSVMSGYSAMRMVHQASKSYSTAVTELKSLNQMLNEDRELLQHREQIEHDYPAIVQTQTAELQAARKAEAQARKKAEEHRRARARIAKQLADLKRANEQKLRPYRNLMDSSRGRSDDAARQLADARRLLKTAEANMADETKRRDQRISAANRAVDNAQERLRHVQDEYDALKADPSAQPNALASMETEVAAEQAHIQTARHEVEQVTRESQQAVDTAQQSLFARQRETNDAERAATTAKAEATTHKTEYESLYKETQAQEKKLDDAIKTAESRAADAEKARQAAQEHANAAQKILDEANDIHNNPATTQGLRERIANEENDLKKKQAEVDSLGEAMQNLRQSTRKSRYLFVLVAIVAFIVVVCLLWFFVVQG